MASRFNTREDHSWVIIPNIPDATKSDRTLIAFNMENGEIYEITMPENTLLNYASWINDEQILINVRPRGSTTDETYIIELSDIRM